MVASLIVFFVATSTCSAERIDLSSSASILHFNSPPAVEADRAIFAGYATGSGGIEVVRIDDKKVSRRATIHRYDTPDDHSAPALSERDGSLLVATSHHSSDLFVYRVDLKTLDSSLICHLTGRFTYPRFIRAGPTSKLIVRTEANQGGGLGVIDISGHACSSPVEVIPADPRKFIYATPPAHIDNDIWIAWSVYDLDRNRHEGVFAGTITGTRRITIKEPASEGPEVIAWSIDSGGVDHVVFSGNMECCDKGAQRLVRTSLDGRHLSETENGRMIYYPSAKPTHCGSSKSLPFMSQRVSHKVEIASEIHSFDHKSKDFRSSVFICIR
ncbi:hypothetical protein SAMN05444123_107200 [Rhodopseudomonas pseudopalustris]|uniref:Uncharacterized protein n=2 Tax=Rhodopseudomonas pseudopalustris TaxID=1513892 RepID=A0A1H8UR86_9BRAD|nr:hypothetical protein SAMN05444123_107200 [Rhodopseudomonas pseudopalustris]